LQTYTLEELQRTQKTSLDYIEEHKRLLIALKEQHPQSDDDETPLWDINKTQDLFWLTGNVIDEEGNKQVGVGKVTKVAGDE
jgi:hypothetical protein